MSIIVFKQECISIWRVGLKVNWIRELFCDRLPHFLWFVSEENPAVAGHGLGHALFYVRNLNDVRIALRDLRSRWESIGVRPLANRQHLNTDLREDHW